METAAAIAAIGNAPAAAGTVERSAPWRGDPAATLLYVDNSLETFLTHRLPLAREAARHGYRVHVAAPRDSSPGPLEEAGLRYHAISLARASLSPWNGLRVVA